METTTIIPKPKKYLPFGRKVLVAFVSFSITVSVAGICIYNAEDLKEIAFSFYSFPDPLDELVEKDTLALKKQLDGSQKRILNLRKRIESLWPKEPYLIVNTTKNNFVLRTRKKIIRENICSTGSYIMLDAGENQQWVFKTPKGQFRILGKVADPIWIKPDWAFVEEGLPVPPKNHPDRYESGTLGDYALSLGQGYLIHGTLYQRFLGLPVTHGCIRLGDDDLKVVYQNLEFGSKVYIF